MKTTRIFKIITFCLILPPLSILGETKPYQAEIINTVLTKLYTTNNNFKKKQPSIEFKNTTVQVAGYYPDKNMIVVEAQAYQICQSMGKDSLNALAFLLGHELTHFYQHAHTKIGFVSNFLSYDKTPQSDTHIEKEADIQGAFNAYLAGFTIQNNIAILLDKIYTAYQLQGKNLAGYPSFEERQHVATEVQQKVNDLIDVYETANYLSAMGQYDFSRLCYEHVLEVFQSREIYNNLGVLSALAAADLSSKNEDNLVFPYELDWTTRLGKKKSRGTETIDAETKAQRVILLKRAQTCFETAVLLDKTYNIAKINKLCILAQLGKTEETLAFYEKIKNRLKKPLEQAQAQIGYALALSQILGKYQDAKTILQKLTNNTQLGVASIAAYNLAVLDKQAIDLPSNNCAISVENQTIDGVFLNRLPKTGYTISLNSIKKAELIFQKQANSMVVQAKMKGGYYFAFQRIYSALPQNTKNTEGGIILTSNGYMSLCEDQHQVFQFDKNNKIVEWVKYYGN